MFRIAWISRLTGNTGYGEGCFTEKVAVEYIIKLNTEFPDLIHTIEKNIESPPSLNLKGHRCSYGDLTFIAHASPNPSVTSNTAESPKGTPVGTPNPVSSSASLPLVQAQVSQQQSSPPPSDFSTSFF